jgi:cell wall-associated NlpC family hydrolase
MPMIAQPARIIRLFALTITVLGLLGGCASHTPAEQHKSASKQVATPPPGVGTRAATVALDQVGVPYRYGGNSPRGFDCSGLVQYSYSRVGRALPRTTSQLWSVTSDVPRDDLQAGDILFFRIEGKMSHVGLYVGNGRFVHAPSSGRSVSVESLGSPFYAAAFIRGGRLH